MKITKKCCQKQTLAIDRGRYGRGMHYKSQFHEERINSIYRPPGVCEGDIASEMITTP